MRNGITKENILLNVELYVQSAFKTQEDMDDEWKKEANKWQVKLVYFDKEYVTDFYMGSGLVDKMGRPKEPTKKDVLYSMIMDDVSNMNFNDFCDSFGYDKDSRKALKIYESCQKETEAYYNMFDSEEREILKELLQDY